MLVQVNITHRCHHGIHVSKLGHRRHYFAELAHIVFQGDVCAQVKGKYKKRIEKKVRDGIEGVRWVGGVGSGSSGDQKGVVSP